MHKTLTERWKECIRRVLYLKEVILAIGNLSLLTAAFHSLFVAGYLYVMNHVLIVVLINAINKNE